MLLKEKKREKRIEAERNRGKEKERDREGKTDENGGLLQIFALTFVKEHFSSAKNNADRNHSLIYNYDNKNIYNYYSN